MSTSTALTNWHPATWRSRKAAQQPVYADPVALQSAVAALAKLPPLVVSWEVEALRAKLAQAQRGEQFLLQGGDCAESFEDCESDNIARRLKILLQMSLVLLQGMKRPVIRVGRFAGQYAKPRSTDTETRGDLTLASYRGDNVNQPGFSKAEREPDPQLLLRGYERAALTLNFVRALVDGGFADLHHPEYWDLGFLRHAPLRDSYQKIVDSIAESLDFFESMSGQRVHAATRGDFYTSHEGLHLLSEEAQTRYIDRQKRWYNLSTHMPWIGMRTANIDGAHVEYFRGISNPIGVKVGAAMSAEWLQALVQVLNPQNQPGRLTFIHRFGVKDIEQRLPDMIRAVRATGAPVLWVCDPMHGNTETTAGGLKTRRFENVLGEVEAAFRIHEEEGSTLGGVHIELTGEDGISTSSFHGIIKTLLLPIIIGVVVNIFYYASFLLTMIKNLPLANLHTCPIIIPKLFASSLFVHSSMKSCEGFPPEVSKIIVVFDKYAILLTINPNLSLYILLRYLPGGSFVGGEGMYFNAY